jgi:hypothetical protein
MGLIGRRPISKVRLPFNCWSNSMKIEAKTKRKNLMRMKKKSTLKSIINYTE